MPTWVLDAHGLMVFLEREPGFGRVQEIFEIAIDERANVLMSAVNFGEVLYIVLRECGQDKADGIERTIDQLPIELVTADARMCREAAAFKAFHRMSYADCFAAALAKLHQGIVITGDPEFAEVEKEITIEWLSR